MMQCVECKGSWNPPKGMNLALCPFCGVSRTPAPNRGVAIVYYDGSIYISGFVNNIGNSNTHGYISGGVRPALWLKI